MAPKKDTNRRGFTAGYTARDVGHILGLTPARIRSYVKAGFLEAPRGRRGEYRFSLRDLVLLRTAKGLLESVPAQRVKKALRKLRSQLPTGRPLTGVKVSAVGDDVVVRDGAALWKVESGQGVFDFAVSDLSRKVAPLVRKAAAAAREEGERLDAEDWYALGFELEACEPEQSRDAYRRALELDPEHPGAHLNLGRLLHEAGHPAAALSHYEVALERQPADSTAAFNLGVALEDLGRLEEAAEAYEQAVSADPRCADAHFNLSRLFERMGKPAAAIRHLKAYRLLLAE